MWGGSCDLLRVAAQPHLRRDSLRLCRLCPPKVWRLFQGDFIVASSFSALRKKQRGPEGASNMVPQRGRPLWTPPAPPHLGTGGGVHPTGASQGRAVTGWVLSLLVRGLAAPPVLHMHRPTK